MNRPLVERYKWVALVVILLVGFILRIWQLDAVPFRGDEAFAASYWTKLPLSESLTTIATIEPHPPFTYVIFHLWGVLTGANNEFSLRLLPALGNLTGIVLIYVLGTRLHSPLLGLIAAAMWALHPFEVWHARDFRNYALWASLSLLVAYTGWRAIHESSRQWQMIYLFSGIAAGLTFYFEILFIGAIALYGVITLRKDRTHLATWILINILVAAIIMATFVMFQGALFSRGDYAGNTNPANPVELITLFPGVLMLGETLSAEMLGWGSLLVLGLFSVGALSAARPNSVTFLLILIVVPLAGLTLVSTRVSVFTPRYVIPAAAPLILMTGMAALSFQRAPTPLRLIIALGCTALIGLGAISNLNTLTGSAIKSPDWHQIRDYMIAYASPNDLIIQTTVDAAFGYYVEPVMDTLALPASPAQTSEEIAGVLQTVTEGRDGIWLFEHSFYPWPNARAARLWLDSNLVKVYETRVMGVPLVRYVHPQISSTEVTNTVNVSFGTQGTIRAVRQERTSTDLLVWLYWEDVPMQPFTASVQLIGPTNPATNNPVWAQSDASIPSGQGLHRDIRTLSVVSLPPGHYDLILKVYDPANGSIVSANNDEYLRVASLELQ